MLYRTYWTELFTSFWRHDLDTVRVLHGVWNVVIRRWTVIGHWVGDWAVYSRRSQSDWRAASKAETEFLTSVEIRFT